MRFASINDLFYGYGAESFFAVGLEILGESR